MPDVREGNLNSKVQVRGEKMCADQRRMSEGATQVNFEGTIPDYSRRPDLIIL